MKEEEIDGLVYSHPIGDWGHSAGPVLGEWSDISVVDTLRTEAD